MLITANGRDSSREKQQPPNHSQTTVPVENDVAAAHTPKPEKLAMSEPDSPAKPKASSRIPWLILFILILLLLITGLIIALLVFMLNRKPEVCLTPACIHTGRKINFSDP